MTHRLSARWSQRQIRLSDDRSLITNAISRQRVGITEYPCSGGVGPALPVPHAAAVPAEASSQTGGRAPAERQGVSYERAALDAIIRHTRSYPYFLQEWGKHCWDCTDESPITAADVRAATVEATAELDASFFRVRFDRLVPSEKRYLRAMAELGGGPHRSGEIARVLDKQVRSVAPARARLIEKGMIYSPAHGSPSPTPDSPRLRHETGMRRAGPVASRSSKHCTRTEVPATAFPSTQDRCAQAPCAQ